MASRFFHTLGVSKETVDAFAEMAGNGDGPSGYRASMDHMRMCLDTGAARFRAGDMQWYECLFTKRNGAGPEVVTPAPEVVAEAPKHPGTIDSYFDLPQPLLDRLANLGLEDIEFDIKARALFDKVLVRRFKGNADKFVRSIEYEFNRYFEDRNGKRIERPVAYFIKMFRDYAE